MARLFLAIGAAHNTPYNQVVYRQQPAASRSAAHLHGPLVFGHGRVARVLGQPLQALGARVLVRQLPQIDARLLRHVLQVGAIVQAAQLAGTVADIVAPRTPARPPGQCTPLSMCWPQCRGQSGARPRQVFAAKRSRPSPPLPHLQAPLLNRLHRLGADPQLDPPAEEASRLQSK